MADLHDLHDLTALEQGALIRKGELTSVEVTEHYLDRIERLDDLGAFVTTSGDQARERAAALPDGDGPLWGVPTAIKDLNLTAGVRTMFGSEAFRDFVPEVSDGITLSIEAAGMVSLGKTNTPEFGSPCYTEPDVAPVAVTPWDRTRMAGGSSGGAAAAVAAGLVPVAHGSDGGGSIRIPASCCGLVGLKPTRGRISGYPMYGDPIGLATGGSLARTVRDAAAMLDVLAGRRAGDPAWAPPPRGTFLAACDREPGRLRIARFIAPVIADVEVDPECVAAYDAASAVLESLGHEISDVPVPLPPDAVPVFETCWAVLTALSVVSPDREHLLRPLTRWLTERGRAVSGAGVRPGHRRDAPVRGRGADRAGAVRRGADADPGRASVARGRDPQRRRSGRGLRGAEGVHAVDLGLEPHGHAGGLAAAALDLGRAAGRRDAGRPAGRGGAAAVAVRAGGGRSALVRAAAAGVVTAADKFTA